jgi:hypothetical protein
MFERIITDLLNQHLG